MHRLEVIKKVAKKIKAKIYIEIGVRYGTVFLRVNAERKIAVDPNLRIPIFNKILFLKDFYRNQYFSKTSDDFFAENAGILKKAKINLAFIDGLHTYKQSLKDVLNCLKYLDDGGVIIMHDCNPITEAMAAPSYEAFLTMEDRGKAWCGDVWKTIVNLRATEPNLKVFVLDTDYGLGIISKGKPESVLNYSATDVENMTYKDLERNRKELLNLKDPSFVDKFVSQLNS